MCFLLNVTKYRCYVDEGFLQERLIIVAIMVPFHRNDELYARLEEMEKLSRRYRTDWNSSPQERRKAFLGELPTLQPLCEIFWREWRTCNNNDPDPKGYTIASAAQAMGPETIVRPMIHRLKRAHVDAIKQRLKGAGVRRDKVPHELRSEDCAGLRLADAVAGYLRHARLKKLPYAEELWPEVSDCLRELAP